MSVESSLNLTPTLSLVRRGSRNLVSPLNPHDVLRGNSKSSSLPFPRGGLGWGNSRTCVYTVALLRGDDSGYICKTEMFPNLI
jgi:hypothetical protein